MRARAGPWLGLASAASLAWLALALPAPAFAQEPASERDRPAWRVGIKVAPPFAMRDDDGDWTGLSVDLWRSVAQDLGVDYELFEISLDDLLAGVQSGELDVGLGAITLTLDRELVMDFSHPFLATGLGIAVPTGSGGLAASLRGLLQPAFWASLSALAAVLLAVGVAIWALERRRPTNDFSPGWRGIGTGFWWSAVTMTTVGYGDVAPRTALGRLLAVVWMFASILMISAFTAAIASSLTVSRLGSIVRSPDDLYRVRVGTAAGTSSAEHLRSSAVPFRAYPDVEAAMAGLADGELDAVVYDAPILQHLARTAFPERVQVLAFTLARQDYALALPPDSPNREAINRALLETLLGPTWGDVLRRYLGRDAGASRP